MISKSSFMNPIIVFSKNGLGKQISAVTRHISPHSENLNVCTPITWYTKVAPHAQVGVSGKFNAASFAQIHKCKLHSIPSVKLGHLSFHCIPVGGFLFCFGLFVFCLFQIMWTLVLTNSFKVEKIIHEAELNILCIKWSVFIQVWMYAFAKQFHVCSDCFPFVCRLEHALVSPQKWHTNHCMNHAFMVT